METKCERERGKREEMDVERSVRRKDEEMNRDLGGTRIRAY
jgi:hypothetical protein